MKLFKKLLAAALAALMLACFAGCHKKDEIAVTIGDFDFTSAYYMCALINADSEARSIVDEAKAEENESDSSSSASTEETDYYSEKVEKTDYVKWVKNKAIETLKQIAAYKQKCKDAKLELDEETEAMAEQYASYYWSSYGYGAIFEPNGVSEATYTKYMKDSYYASLYFEHLYGKGGDKEIAADEVSKTMLDNFVVANIIDVDYSSMEDAEKTSTTAKFNTYLSDLQSGKRSFAEIYKEYNKITEEQEKEQEAAADPDAPAPKDKYASILGSADTSYASDSYDTAKAMAAGEIKLVTKENNAGVTLLIKQDISADPYYLETLDMSIRDMIKGEEYAEDMEKLAKELKAEVNDYAVNNFKVKKIVYPEAQQ